MLHYFLLTISVRNIDFIEDSFVFTNPLMFGRLDLTTYVETVFLANSQQVVTPTHTPRSAQLNVIPFLKIILRIYLRNVENLDNVQNSCNVATITIIIIIFLYAT